VTDSGGWSDHVIDDFGDQVAVNWSSHEEGEDDEFVHLVDASLKDNLMSVKQV
jgi:hypothetical protein